MTDAESARKRVAAGALIRDRAGRVLLVEPTYREDWLPPGGAVEAHESPAQGADREVLEELGVRIPIGRPLAMQWMDAVDERDDLINFLYDGGVVGTPVIERFRLERGLASYRFVDSGAVGTLASAATTALFVAARQALDHGTFVELP